MKFRDLFSWLVTMFKKHNGPLSLTGSLIYTAFTVLKIVSKSQYEWQSRDPHLSQDAYWKRTSIIWITCKSCFHMIKKVHKYKLFQPLDLNQLHHRLISSRIKNQGCSKVRKSGEMFLKMLTIECFSFSCACLSLKIIVSWFVFPSYWVWHMH